jgi:tRNA pseudouridine38-40 synthase
MNRWKITVEYDGSGFSGWQKQPDAISVQQTLEQAVEKLSGEVVTLHTAGRTDAGVHARAQVAHFDMTKEFPDHVIRDALNFHIRPHKIAVLKVEQVDEAFHARFGALGRSYRYRIINRRAPLALEYGHAWHVMRPLNVTAMQTAAALLLGSHDFSTFRAQFCQAKSPFKTLDQLDITQSGEEIVIHTAARSFLYHQVRNMVGTLSLVGSGRWTLANFKSAFEERDRTKGGPTAPPQGLCFWGVTYPGD